LRRLRLRLRLRGRRPVDIQVQGASGARNRGMSTSQVPGASPALPSAELLRRQAEWLAPARARILRRLNIAHKRRVIDLGAGYGAVTPELVRRTGAQTAARPGGSGTALVLAMDRSFNSLCESEVLADAARLNADAARLPLQPASFDLVFCQCSLLWIEPLESCLDEIARVLQPGGALVAIEPDYGGMIEHPAENASRHLWLSALARVGAEPRIGRLLPGLLADRGFAVRVDLFDRLHPPDMARFDFLRELPLTEDEAAQLDRIQASTRSTSGWNQIAHLPFFLITAEKTATGNW
jgi:SAM-dependent methyltransferase